MITFFLEKKLLAGSGQIKLAIDCKVAKGQFFGLYGPSGAGKTSVLRMLAGLLAPDRGFIEVHGEIWYDASKNINLPPQKRSVGFVFQDYALFPNMTVLQNLSFALPKGHSNTIIEELIHTIELEELQNRKPATLSGGQQQRVALARALVRKPALLLLDEPLSALDQSIRQKLQDYILASHQKYGLTTLLVTHDQAEINKLADQILIIKEGKIIQKGLPASLFLSKKGKAFQEITGIFNGYREKDKQMYILLKIKEEEIWIPVEKSLPFPPEVGKEVRLSIKENKTTVV